MQPDPQGLPKDGLALACAEELRGPLTKEESQENGLHGPRESLPTRRWLTTEAGLRSNERQSSVAPGLTQNKLRGSPSLRALSGTNAAESQQPRF